jgi:hypothetical protein
MNSTMINRLWTALYKFSAIVALGALFLAGVTCPAEAAGDHDDGAAGPAGTLTYQGAANGSVTFPSADCTFDAKKRLVAFEAPHQDKMHPEIVTPGPLLDIGLVDPGAMIMFTSDHLHTTPQNAFMRLQQKDGVSVAKKGNQWLVTITALQLPNQDVMNQKSVTISGTLACTHLING